MPSISNLSIVLDQEEDQRSKLFVLDDLKQDHLLLNLRDKKKKEKQKKEQTNLKGYERYCIKPTGFNSFKLTPKKCDLDPVNCQMESKKCINCKNCIIVETNEFQIKLPFPIIELFGIKDGQKYFIFKKDDKYLIELDTEKCEICKTPRSKTAELYPIKDTYICDSCYREIRAYRLMIS